MLSILEIMMLSILINNILTICNHRDSEDETDDPEDKKHEPKETGTDGSGFDDILNRPPDYNIDWGPSGFSKSNHPLAIMVTNPIPVIVCTCKVYDG